MHPAPLCLPCLIRLQQAQCLESIFFPCPYHLDTHAFSPPIQPNPVLVQLADECFLSGGLLKRIYHMVPNHFLCGCERLVGFFRSEYHRMGQTGIVAFLIAFQVVLDPLELCFREPDLFGILNGVAGNQQVQMWMAVVQVDASIGQRLRSAHLQVGPAQVFQDGDGFGVWVFEGKDFVKAGDAVATSADKAVIVEKFPLQRRQVGGGGTYVVEDRAGLRTRPRFFRCADILQQLSKTDSLFGDGFHDHREKGLSRNALMAVSKSKTVFRACRASKKLNRVV